MKDNIIFGLGILVGLVLIYLFGGYFFGLVGDLYDLLDKFLWAFFAGIIAFIAAITITGLVVQVSIISVTLISLVILQIITLFER